MRLELFKINGLIGILVGFFLLAGVYPVAGADNVAGSQEERKRIFQDVRDRVFIVNEYRYEPGQVSENLETGLSLCGTRCNALSAKFSTYIKPGGWRLIRTVSNLEVAVKTGNPFLEGQCICVGDEYEVDFFDPVDPKERPAQANAWQTVGDPAQTGTAK